MVSLFEQYVASRERPPVVVDMDGYRAGLLSYGPTPQETKESLVLQVESAFPGNVAAMIAAGSKRPVKMAMIPSNSVAAKLRMIANGGETDGAWSPQSILRQSALNMGRLGRILQMAISGIPTWNGSIVHVSPSPKIWSEPAIDGDVKVDRCGCGNTFKAGVLGKGLRMSDVGSNPYGAFDIDSQAQEDFFSIIQALQNGVKSRPRMVKMYVVAPPRMRPTFAKAGKEATILKTAYIPPMPMTMSRLEGVEGDVWAIRVDERLIGLPIDGIYWPAEDEPLEIRHIELVRKNEEHQDQTTGAKTESVSGDRHQQSDSPRV